MDIQKEIKISENQPAVFIADTELGELYKAAVKHWGLDKDNCLVFATSLFYNLGRTHGIRADFVVITANRSIEGRKGLIILKWNVLFAARNLSRINIQKRRHVHENAEQSYLSIIEIKSIGKKDTYNMEVKNHHNYSVCGGFIIHNCMDAWRYLTVGMWKQFVFMLPVSERGDGS